MTARILKLTLTVAFVGVALGAPLFAQNSIDVTPDAALGGSFFGLEVILDGSSNKTFVVDKSPDDDTSYCMRFRVDPNTLDLPNGRKTGAVKAQTSNNRGILFFDLQASNTGKMKGKARMKNGPGDALRKARFRLKPGEDHTVEICGSSASAPGAADGTFRVVVDGDEKINRTDMSKVFGIGKVKVGATHSLGLGVGSYFLDDFSSFRTLAP